MTIEERVEAEIDALLTNDDTASVIDALLTLPNRLPANDVDGAWERLLRERLQARLAQKMRQVLESREPDSSRSAA